MVHPWTIMIGLGVGLAGILFMMFQEERQRRQNPNSYMANRRQDDLGGHSLESSEDHR